MTSSSDSKTTTVKTLISTVSSVATAAMVARTVARDFLPPEFQHHLYSNLRNFLNKLSGQLTVVINQFDGIRENEIYTATELYLSSRISPEIKRINVTRNPSQKDINVVMEINERLTDYFNGVKFKWLLVSKTTSSSVYHSSDDFSGSGSGNRSDERSFELTCHRKHSDMVMNEYFPFILKVAEARKLERKTVKILTVDYNQMPMMCPLWKPVNLDHPSTFATLAMDSELKENIMKDLDRFVERREYYRRVGKAWKRGYLLYGPPGTGKSSLIAAMANYLNFDIYDLELTNIRSNSILRQLLVATANRSILVVEDIDCSAELHDRAVPVAVTGYHYQQQQKQHSMVTLSGFLNFIDGLWSSCGDERIIVFTTNRKDKLDSALLRPGRMDVHIHMSYCTPTGFRLLASNYLGVTQHDRFEEIQGLIEKLEITPAEVAEQLLRGDDPDGALDGLVEFLDVKKKESEEAKEREEKREAQKNCNEEEAKQRQGSLLINIYD